MLSTATNNGPYQDYDFNEVINDIRITAQNVHQLGLSRKSKIDIEAQSLTLLRQLREFCGNPPTTWKMGLEENDSETLILELYENNGIRIRLKPASVSLSCNDTQKLEDIVDSDISIEQKGSEFYKHVKTWYVHHISVYGDIQTIEIAPEKGPKNGLSIPLKLMRVREYSEKPVRAKTVSRSIVAMVVNSQSEREWANEKVIELGKNVMQSISLQKGAIKFDMEVVCRQIKHEFTEHRQLRALLYAMFIDNMQDGFFEVNQDCDHILEVDFNREGNINKRINWSVLVAVVFSITLAIGSTTLQKFFDNLEFGSFVEVLTASLIVTVGYVAVIREPDWDLLYALQRIEPLGRFYRNSNKEKRKAIVIELMKRGLFQKRFGRRFASFLPSGTSGNINLEEPCDLQWLNKGGALVGICNGKLGVFFEGELNVTYVAAPNRLYRLEKDIGVLTLTDYAVSVRIGGSDDF